MSPFLKPSGARGMRPRELLAALGSAALALPPAAAHAQQRGKPPLVGFMGTTTAAAWTPWAGAFVQRMRELGWIDGHTVAIEYRWAESRRERFPEIAGEFARLKV